jgi:hypothetical protein
MPRLRVPELVAGLLLGFAFLPVILLLSSDIAAHYEICETTKEGAKECARYGVIQFALREIGSVLDTYNGLITAIATAFIAWFTLSLRQSTDKLWKAGERGSNWREKLLLLSPPICRLPYAKLSAPRQRWSMLLKASL